MGEVMCLGVAFDGDDFFSFIMDSKWSWEKAEATWKHSFHQKIAFPKSTSWRIWKRECDLVGKK